MDRFELIQKTINNNRCSSYVEIGFYRGRSFLPVKCINKIAVDPSMKISWRGKLFWIFKNPYNINNKFFDLTSDEFFEIKAPLVLRKKKVDLFFIDGLHTFSASLRDVLNSLKYLKNNGTIIMHDCYPPHKAAATPASSFNEAKLRKVKGWNGQWCGDVWKTIIYLRKKYPGILEVSVLNKDFGLGIIKIKIPHNFTLEIDEGLFREINLLNYDSVFTNPAELLNLKEI